MAICLRRAAAARGLLSLVTATGRRAHAATVTASHLSDCATGFIFNTKTLPVIPPSPLSSLSWRGFAKGRKTRGDEDDGDMVRSISSAAPDVKSTAASQMEAAIVALSRELSKLRTGRASSGMLDHILVEMTGVKTPLNHAAVVSVIDAQTLSVTVYDPDTVKAVEHALIASPLGINPIIDGQRIIAPIPPLTKEAVQALCKVVTKSAEDVKQSIRRARQKALDTIKKAGMPKDDAKRVEKEIEELTKRFIKSAEDMCKAKEKEISGGR